MEVPSIPNKKQVLAISRDTFIEALGYIKKQWDNESELNTVMSKILGHMVDDFFFDSYETLLIKVLEQATYDTDGFISWFIYDTLMGKKAEEMKCTIDGVEVVLYSAGDLYDLLEALYAVDHPEAMNV